MSATGVARLLGEQNPARRLIGRTHILGVLVNEAHVIHEWAESFRKDYSELKTLRVILRNDIPWWALSATFTNKIFKPVLLLRSLSRLSSEGLLLEPEMDRDLLRFRFFLPGDTDRDRERSLE